MRSALVSDWIAQTEWSSWQRAAMTGDASARRYERLTGSNGTSVILMDAPPDTCGSQNRFVEIAAHLRAIGLAAPDVLGCDEARGLMVLEDLGQIDFATHLDAKPLDEPALYQAAAETLLILQSAPAPTGFEQMTPQVGADMVDIAFEWAASDASEDLSTRIKTGLQQMLHTVDPDPQILSLRDFHAENLIWRPDQTGPARVGLLDFQDAFITHPAYDLASLVRDARRDVDPTLLDGLIRQMAGSDVASFKTAFHVMAVQRNLRILGIFERLARRDGKTAYLTFIPRVRRHLATDLATPELAEIAPLIRRAFDINEGNL